MLALAEAIKRNNSLKLLYLKSSGIWKDKIQMSEKTSFALFEAVAINTSINEFTVDDDQVPLPLKGKSVPEIRQYFRLK